MEEKELVIAAKSGDNNAKELLISKYEKYIKKLTNKFMYGVYTEDFEGLYHYGVMGLLEALKNYNPDSNAKFLSYATMYIKDELMTGMQLNRTSVAIPTHVYGRYRKAYSLNDEDREAYMSKGDHKNELVENYENIKNFTNTQSLESFNDNVPFNDLNTTSWKEHEEKICDTIMLEKAIKKLDAETKEILKRLYMDGYCKSDVSKQLGLTMYKTKNLLKAGLESIENDLKGECCLC